MDQVWPSDKLCLAHTVFQKLGNLTFYSHKNLDFWLLLKTEKVWEPWPAFLRGRGSQQRLPPFQGLPLPVPSSTTTPIVFQPPGRGH